MQAHFAEPKKQAAVITRWPSGGDPLYVDKTPADNH